MLRRLLLWFFLFCRLLLLLRRRLGLRPRLRLRPGLHLGLRPRLRLRLRPGLDLGLWPRLHLGLRARLRLRRRLHPGRRRWLRPRLGLDLGLRPRGYLRLWPRLRWRFRSRLDPGWCLGLRARLRLRPGLHLELRPHRGFHLRRSLGLNLRRFLGRYLGLAGGAAGLRCPWGSRGGWRPWPDPRVEFSRFSLTGWRGAGLYLARFGRGGWLHLARFGRDPGLHLGRLGRNARLELARFGLGARLDRLRWFRYSRLHLAGSARRYGLSRFSRSGRLPRSRLGRCGRGKRLGFARHKLLLGGQLLNLLGHLRGQGHGSLAGQSRARQALSRLQRCGLDPGNSGGEPGNIFGRRYEIGPVQINLGHFDIGRQPGWRQALALDQGRRDNLPDITMPVDHPAGRHHIVNPGEVVGVPDDSLVDDRLVDVGDPGDVSRRGTHVIVAGAESPTAEKSRRVIGRGGVSRDILRLGIKYRHI